MCGQTLFTSGDTLVSSSVQTNRTSKKFLIKFQSRTE